MSRDRQPRDRRRELELEAKRLNAAARGLDRYIEHRDNTRFAIWRQAAIYVPSGLLLTALWVVGIMNLPGSIIAVIVLTLFVIPVDLEAISAVRDLFRREPVTSRGPIDRQWAKARFMFLGRVRYLLVSVRRVEDGQVNPDRKPKGTLFEVGELANLQLQPGDQIEVVHWPHTNVIVSLELLSKDPDPERASEPPVLPNRAWEELDGGQGIGPWAGR